MKINMRTEAIAITYPTDDKAKTTYLSMCERIAFKNLHSIINDFDITYISKVESYSLWDVAFLSAGTNYIAETKIRNYSMDDFSRWIIERDKYDYLVQIEEFTPVYINFFKNGCAIWILDRNFPPKFVKNSFKKYSFKTNNSYVDKEVAYLDLKDAHIYKYDTNLIKINSDATIWFENFYPGLRRPIFKKI